MEYNVSTLYPSTYIKETQYHQCHFPLIKSPSQSNKLNTEYLQHITKKKIYITLSLHGRFEADRENRGRTQKQLQRVKTFSDDIHLELGLDKGANIVFLKGKLVQSKNLVLRNNREIRDLVP